MKVFVPIISTLLFAAIGCDKPLVEDVDNENDQQDEQHHFVYASDHDGGFVIYEALHDNITALVKSDTAHYWGPRICAATNQLLYYAVADPNQVSTFDIAELWMRDLNNGFDTLLFSGDSRWKAHGMADWSNDGKQVVFAAIDSNAQRWQLYLLTLSTGEIHKISERHNYDYIDPVFSSSGRSVYCSVVPDNEPASSLNTEIFELVLADSTETRLTENSTRDQRPSPSPDGQKICFESLVEPSYLGIGRWNLSELDLGSLSTSEFAYHENLRFFPRYSANGNRIYFTQLDVKSFELSIWVWDVSTATATEWSSEGSNTLQADPY